MNALTTATTKVLTEVERIERKLVDIDDAYDYKRSNYRHDQFTRQGARALGRKLELVAAQLRVGDTAGANEDLDTIAGLWNSREDWRAGAFAANVARAVERLVGLGS